MENIQLVFVHMLALATGSVLFALLMHYQLLGAWVYFYRGVLLLLVAALVVAAGLYALSHGPLSELITGRDIVLAFLAIFSINLVFFTHVPVTADRSVTIFMLGYMNDRPDLVYTREQVRDFFIQRYVDDYDAIQRRFDEQVVSGNLETATQGYKLSNRGRRLMQFYHWVSDVYGVDKKFISPSSVKPLVGAVSDGK
jgi:hypothetical protein